MKYKIVLIPAYKPVSNFIDLIKNLSNTDFDIVIVDDGSGPEYKNIFDAIEKYAKVISYEENRGKGHALKTGLRYIADTYSEYIVVTMDADGQHTIPDAIKVATSCLENCESLIVGKRKRTKKTPLRSRVGNAITRFVYKVATGIDVYDTQSGLRAFSEKIADRLVQVEGNRYEYEMNVLLECARQKIKIKEVEITTIYIDNNSNSHFKTIRDSLLIYKKLLKYRRENKK